MRMLICLAAILAMLAPLSAQEPANDTADTGNLPRIQVDVNIVNVLASVRDKQNRFIADLSKDDFIVKEDGKQQEIRYFTRQTDLPLTMGLLVDVSGSQESLIEVEKQAAYQFFAQVLRPKDLAFLMSFGASVDLLQDLTASADLLRGGLDELHLNAAVGGPTPGTIPNQNMKGTVLWDAVFLAADEQLKNEVGRKAIIVISDGVDMGSMTSKNRALEAAQKSDAIIYSIYYADPRFQSFANGYGDLKNLSEQTGGSIFRVDRRTPLQAVFTEIQNEMRNQYAIGYTPTNSARDGSYRKLQIQTTRKGLKVAARKGYFAAEAR